MRQQIIPLQGESLSGYLTRIQANFIELYRAVNSNESGFTGLNAGVLTAGLIPDERINPNFRRRIIDGTGQAPDPTNLPEGTVYLRHE